MNAEALEAIAEFLATLARAELDGTSLEEGTNVVSYEGRPVGRLARNATGYTLAAL